MGTIYKDYTDKPLADLNLDYHKIKKLTHKLNEHSIRHASAFIKQGMHCNITQATTVKDWVRVLRHTPPLTHINFFLIVWSLNHAGCVITTSGVFSFLFFWQERAELPKEKKKEKNADCCFNQWIHLYLVCKRGAQWQKRNCILYPQGMKRHIHAKLLKTITTSYLKTPSISMINFYKYIRGGRRRPEKGVLLKCSQSMGAPSGTF